MNNANMPDTMSELSERVGHELFGPARYIGPFPADCPSLRRALDDQPASEYQRHLAGALKKALGKFHFERPTSDGAIRRIRLRKGELQELEHRRVFEYLSRLLLAYVLDDPERRARLRPDLVAWQSREMAESLAFMAETMAAHGRARDAEELRSMAAGQLRLAERHERLRPRVGRGHLGAGRPTKLPKPRVLASELKSLKGWLAQRWPAIRDTARRDRGPWVKDLQSVLKTEIEVGRTLDDPSLTEVLWPPRGHRTAGAAAAAILAAVYDVAPRSIQRATKTPTRNL